MPSPNQLKKAKYRAIAQLLDAACLNAGWSRPDLREVAPPAWLALGPQRRASYCTAERLMSHGLLDQLVAEYPVAGDVRNSVVWLCLSEAATPAFLEQRLRALMGREERELHLEHLLSKLARSRLDDGPFDLGLVVRYVCATKLSKSLGRQAVRDRQPSKGLSGALDTQNLPNGRRQEHVDRKDLPGMLAMRLARALYMVAVDELLAPLAREVWIYAGHAFASGLKLDDGKVRFSEEAFDFGREYVMRSEANITLSMVPKQPARRISASALREIVAGALFGLTDPTCSKAHRTMTEMLELDAAAVSVGRRRNIRSALILQPLD